ncbi:MAG: sorbosone dehydrogenase family protein [Betaproteobacteria bacterium]|nr:sorbosone dehydrogenase family protein [Betaproteobacteria bacterium]
MSHIALPRWWHLAAAFAALLCALPTAETAHAQAAAAPPPDSPGQDLPLQSIRLPPGFRIELWARVENARAMVLGARNTVFVGSRSGKVHAVPFDPAMRARPVKVIARDLRMPVGVSFRNGALYASAVERILRWDDIEARLDHPPAPLVVSDAFPRETHHGWKFIAFGPDGKLYVPVGAPCNICAPDPDRYAVIMRMDADGSNLEVFARGVRNSVGFDWQPGTGELWFTDNGRDWMGDDAPPCELNRAPRAGLHFGYPYCHGGTLPDPEYGQRRRCDEFAAPAQNLGAHVAPLGMRFYTGTLFPPEYRGQIFIAEHGSWNRSRKSGYRITLVRVKDGRAVSYEPFAVGWQRNEKEWGRPADVLVMPDGSLLVSDDFAGAIYRIRYAAGR